VKPPPLTLLLACAVFAALVWPAASPAGGPMTFASVSAQVTERVDTNTWEVEITWSSTCNGVAQGKEPRHSGDLWLVDVDTGDRTYVGGVVDNSGRQSVSGTRELNVFALPRVQHLQPEFEAQCYEVSPQIGGNVVTATGDPVTIPAAFGGGGGGGGGGSGGGGGGGGGDPTEPTRAGGCANALIGTNAPDVLTGGGEGDVIIGFNGADRLEGREDHDCLVGGKGDDSLLGEEGFDRLTAGKGDDLLDGGPDVNSYNAGRGRDFVKARNGKRERVRCGSGLDRAKVDRRDRVRSCERLNPRS
jgi:Ca2+-binding RTX toxin-like protein